MVGLGFGNTLRALWSGFGSRGAGIQGGGGRGGPFEGRWKLTCHLNVVKPYAIDLCTSLRPAFCRKEGRLLWTWQSTLAPRKMSSPSEASERPPGWELQDRFRPKRVSLTSVPSESTSPILWTELDVSSVAGTNEHHG